MHKNVNLPLICQLVLLSLPAYSQAGSVSADYQFEALKAGEHWQNSGLSVQALLAPTAGLKSSLRIENETRNAGDTQRLFVTGSISVSSKSTLELSLAKGWGAEYGFQSQRQLTAYTAVGSLDTAAGLTQTDYAASTTTSVFFDARLPVASTWTLIAGARNSDAKGKQVGHFYKLGLEKSLATCTVSVLGYSGKEARDAALPENGSISSKTAVLGARCPLGSRVQLGLTGSRTIADTLTRNGVSLSVSATY